MNNPFVRPTDSIKQARNSSLNRTYQISLKKIIALLLIVTVASAVFFWAENTAYTHRNWATMAIEAQEFNNHMFEARAMGGRISSDNSDFSTARNELGYSIESIDKILELDSSHNVELGQIDCFLSNLYGLNDTQRSDLSSKATDLPIKMELIGEKVLSAYTGFINYTSIDMERGPSIWYFGPAPPDEATLQTASNLASHYNSLISF
jgi:hypothetical protein